MSICSHAFHMLEIRGDLMSGFRLFCFKQFFKVHVFCLLMMVVFRMFMNVNLGVLLWMVLIISTLCSLTYLLIKPFAVTKDIYAIMAISSCISLSIIAQRFLWVALRIDLINMAYFLLSMVIYGMIVMAVVRLKGRGKKRRSRKKKDMIKRLRYLGWGFLLFLFFYQLVLSYLLRPNFLTVLALSVSHINLLLIMWTYFDVKKLYEVKK